ncbi:MAG: hypothetical protein V1774_03075, partial [Candidatus Eisenbacteria bacterium]
QMEDGQLSDHPLQIALADYLDSPSLASLSISDWAQPFHIENGRLSFDGLTLAAGGIEVTGRGWQALDGRVEMGLHIALPREFSDALRGRLPAELAQVLLAGDDARILLPFTVSGEMPKPKIAIDVEALRAGARERIQERLREESERLQQEARGRLQEEAHARAGGLLDRILGGTRDTTGRADTLAADSLAPAETTRTRSSEIEEDVQGLLKGLLKGGGKR